MSRFNDKLKSITIREVCILIIVLFIIYYSLNDLKIIKLDSVWIYIFIIGYFIFKLRCCFSSLREDFFKVFSINQLKYIFLVVILNILMSYGFLYLSDFLLKVFPALSFLAYVPISSVCLNASVFGAGGFIATVFISPVCEELIFRGVMLNRFRLVVPTSISILLTSLLFASLHTYGSITAAFVFAICMAIFYLRTDNICVPIFAHFLNNLLAESIVFLDVNNVLFSNDIVMYMVSFLAIVSAILIIASIFDEWNS